MLYEMERKVG